MVNVLIAGVGGQGTVLASKLLAECAIEKGYYATTSETIGMAQRGGCVVSHVRYAKNVQDIHSPLIPFGTADALLAFEPSEAVRNLKYLKENGKIIVCTSAIAPTTNPNYTAKEMLEYLENSVYNVEFFDMDKLSNKKTLNVAILGLLLKNNELDVTIDELKDVVTKKIPEKFIQINFKALEEIL